MFIRRTRRDDPWLQWRIRFLAGGAILGIIGMVGETLWLVYVSMGLLVVGFLMRFLR